MKNSVIYSVSFTCLKFIRTYPHIHWFQLNILSVNQKQTERTRETKTASSANSPSRARTFALHLTD